MNFLRGIDAVLNGSGEGPVDWTAAAEAAKADVEPGSTDLSDEATVAYATALREFREPIGRATGTEAALPDSIDVLDRHHWIDAQVATCRRVTAGEREQANPLVEALGAVVGTERLGSSLSVVAESSLGRYDRHFPLPFADGRVDEVHLVHANVERTAEAVDAAPSRLRRWAVAHELVHAAELAAAPWLREYLRERVRTIVRRLEGEGRTPDEWEAASEVRELQGALVAAEGYASLVLARSFDDGYAALHREVDAARWRGGGLGDLLGVERDPELYGRGRQFFAAVVDARGLDAANAALASPGALPTLEELQRPQRWLDRVDP